MEQNKQEFIDIEVTLVSKRNCNIKDGKEVCWFDAKTDDNGEGYTPLVVQDCPSNLEDGNRILIKCEVKTYGDSQSSITVPEICWYISKPKD